MKRYKILVTFIIAIGLLLIGTSDPIRNIRKSTGFINKGYKANLQTDDNKKDGTVQKNSQINEKFLICIDPGHQEKGDSNLEPIAPGSPSKKPRVSSGAAGVATKKPEYVLNLEASTVLKHILEGKGFKVVMTRDSHDVNISNSERAIFANDKKADMVVRIHADSLNNPSKTGASILIPQKDGKYTKSIYEESSVCAQIVEGKMREGGVQVNGIFQRDDLTGFNWSKVPVVLVEMGFMSNYNEDRLMSSPEYQRKLMQTIADGLEEYFMTK